MPESHEASSAAARAAGRLLRVEHDGPQAGRLQVGELVVLQRDQRRDDDRRPGPQQPGQLVDRRLPAAGRQHGQHVAAGGQRLGRAQLPGTKPLEAETLARELLDHGSAGRARRNGDGQREQPGARADGRDSSLTPATIRSAGHCCPTGGVT